MPRRFPRPASRRVRVLALVSTALAILGTVALASPAQADTGQITVNKTVQGAESATLAPGDEFTYTIQVGCDDAACLSAHLSDAIPSQFEGFAITTAPRVTPANQPSTVSLAGCSVDSGVTSPCTLNADFIEPLSTGGVGIEDGATYTVTIGFKVPQDLTPAWPFDDQAITNTANGTADNSAPASDTADVTVHVPVVIDTTVTKKWTPATQQYAPGAASTVTLTTRNSSNLAAATLVLQDPQNADAGAESLAAGNPFDLVDFTGFGAVSPPQGADRLQVDAYVFDGTAWHWISGTPGALDAIALPDGVTAGQVGGLRFTFSAESGAAIVPDGTAGSIAVNVAQRATTRSGAPLVSGSSVTNVVADTVTVPGHDPKTETASAPYAITGLDVKVGASKTITPSRVPAGVPAKAIVSAQNQSNGPLTRMSLDDSGYFTDDLHFNGFTAPVAWPTGATGGTITWHFSDGSQSGPTSFASGSTPAAPVAPGGAWLTGFTFDYTGSIPSSQSATAQFSILPAADMVSEAAVSQKTTNTVSASGTNPAGDANASATAPLEVFFPTIQLALGKAISPSGAVAAGGTVVAKLTATTSTQSQFVSPDTIVVEDSLRSGANDFWNAFDPIAIAPTAVPLGSKLLIEYTTDGSTWTALGPVIDATGAAQLYSGALPAGVVGVRFTFTDQGGFPKASAVAPNVVFQARAQLRDGSGPTAVPDDPAKDYENSAVANASGTVDGPTAIVADPVDATADGHIVAFSGADGTLGLQKRWVEPGNFSTDLTDLPSQSGDRAGTVLTWAVRQTGVDSVTISDPSTDADAATPHGTAFQAFDLVAVPPISSSVDPLLKWDAVQSVQLFRGGAWQTVTPPAGGWMSGGAFVGYTLTGSESAASTGVRLTVVPNDAARAASSDPTRPLVGSGVATSSTTQPRAVRLLWQLRNVARVPDAQGQWVTATHGYDVAGDASAISNTASLTGVSGTTSIGPVTDSDTVSLLDAAPGVAIAKSASPSKLVVPESADVAPGDYPSATFTMTAHNTSPSRASYVRVTDPALCGADTADCVGSADAWGDDPFASVAYDATANPFETTTLTKIAFTLPSAAVVDPAASTVTLWHRAGDGTLSTTTASVTAAQALAPADLADVVGVSVVYQGADPAATGGAIDGSSLTMTLTAQLRVFERSHPATRVSANGTPSVDDRAYAQSYDPVLWPASSGAISTPHDVAAAGVPLASGELGIAPVKTITPNRLLESNRTDPVSVTLAASDGGATVATERVTLSDTTPGFWNRFELTGLGAVQLPAGADTVRVDVQRDGDTAWTQGTAAATAALPDVPLDQVTGIRFVFWHTGDTPFSTTAPPQTWSASAVLPVALRATQRDGSAIAFPTDVDNTVTATSERLDDLYDPKSADTDAHILLDTGTFTLDVAKAPAGNIHTVAPGDSTPWTLTFHNTGTGFLDVTTLVDTLDPHLQFDGEDPSYADSGSMGTPAADASGDTLTFTWPAGTRMAPGEAFTITAGFVLLPGLTASQQATNQFVVSTKQTLAGCTNTSGNGQGVLGGQAVTDCGTSNFVQPQAGASLLTGKGSRGDVAGPQLVTGATNTSNPSGTCTPDADGFYRSPCAANSVVGATDEWKLTAQNSGTVAYRSLVLVDPLPQPGDRMLATGSARGSSYRPVLDGAAGITLGESSGPIPTGTTVVEEVTTAADACWGTGTTWNSDSTCSTHPVAASWTALGSYAGDWSAVTAIRIRLDFTTSAAGSLAPGDTIVATYRTTNEPASSMLPAAAPITPSATAPVAWNQYGATAVTTAGATIARAPAKAGVILPTGSIQLDKTITGAGSGYAPDDFVADVACTIAGATMDLGTQASLHLLRPALRAWIDGLPLGAHCTATEHGAVGSFGETSRGGVPVEIDVTTATAAGDNVPVAQTGTITNAYDLSSLTIAKVVDTDATVGAFGPFEVTVACESIAGGPVTLAAGDAAFSLTGGASHTISDLPVGATCAVTETEADDATSTTFAGAGVTADGGRSADVVVQPTASTATITNHYDTGTLSVLKVLEGSGASYGTGPFTASVACTYHGGTVYTDGAVAIVPGTPTPIAERFPVGTVCAVVEVHTGGANAHDDPPAVTIAAGDTVADVTNHFEVGELHIVKERTGPGVEQFGDGPFTAHVECTWQRDGTTVTIPLPDAGDVTLDAAGDYEATVSDLLVGSSCVVSEPDAGLAVATTFDPADGAVTILDPATVQTPATVTITNDFQVGRLELRKTADVANAKVGQNVPYTIRVTNTGGVAAKGASVTDVLPAGATVVSADGGVVTATDVTWTIADLPIGQSVSHHLVLRFSRAGATVNTAHVDNPPGPFVDPKIDDPCPGSATDACADVQIATLALTGLDDPLRYLLPASLAVLLGAMLAAGAAFLRRRRV